MNSNATVRSLALVLAILGMATAAGAQVTTGLVAGTVKDAQGGIIPGATVALTSESRGTKLPEVVTSGTGDFTFVNLPPDTYQVTITMTGFRTLTRGGIAVSPGDRVALTPFTVQLSGTTETVNVTGEAPVIQSRSGERSFTVDTKSVENLPILSRSFTALAALAPGVTLDGNGTPQRLGGGGARTS